MTGTEKLNLTESYYLGKIKETQTIQNPKITNPNKPKEGDIKANIDLSMYLKKWISNVCAETHFPTLHWYEKQH